LSKNRKQRRTNKNQRPNPVVQGLTDEGSRHHQAGRLAEAERAYRQALAIDPRHADALHLLGVLANGVGRHEVAVELIGQAVALQGNVYFFHSSLGNALKNLGRIDDAAKHYDRALALNPDSTEALNNLGNIYMEQGRYEDALIRYRRTIALNPGHPETHNNIGTVLRRLGKLDEARTAYDQALALRPDYAEAHLNIGCLLRDQGNFSDAVSWFERSAALNPNYVDAWVQLGHSLLKLGRLDEAVKYFRHALTLKPDSAEALINLGYVLVEQGKLRDAEQHCRHALDLVPNNARLLNTVGSIFLHQGKAEEALAFFEQALVFEPDSASVLNHMAIALKIHGRIDESIACYRRAIVLDPHDSLKYSNLLMAMVYAASISPQELAATARKFGELADPLRRQRPFIRDRNPERKLRIGYVSPDFWDHAVNYFFEFLTKLHDRRQFEIYAYSNVMREDYVTVRLKQSFDHWRDIKRLDNEKAADLIEADEIDILVDLAGHTAYNRLPVFARKPAPVQVTWLGYPATTGMKTMDYRITDSYAEPVGMTEALNAETLWRLPEVFCCYHARENSPAVINHPPFEDNGYVTFGCFNNFTKVTDPVLETWARIMARVPDSRLLLEVADLEGPQFRASLEERLRGLGIPLDRAILEPRKKSNQFVLYNRIDIALDPFPCAGGTTSMDTMWMGVPFITLAGKHFVSRLGVTILTNVGMPELIAGNTDEYVTLAVSLALDRERLRGLRHNLRDRMAASPLMDQAAFTSNMEASYREMWRKWCATKSDTDL
jgi:protein O-GlcNAc transferase